MAQTSFDTAEFKEVLKEALTETLSEQRELLHEVYVEVDFLLEQVKGLTKETFLRDETRKRAFVRSLGVIDEAAGLLIESLDDEPDEDLEEAWRA